MRALFCPRIPRGVRAEVTYGTAAFPRVPCVTPPRTIRARCRCRTARPRVRPGAICARSAAVQGGVDHDWRDASWKRGGGVAASRRRCAHRGQRSDGPGPGDLAEVYQVRCQLRLGTAVSFPSRALREVGDGAPAAMAAAPPGSTALNRTSLGPGSTRRGLRAVEAFPVPRGTGASSHPRRADEAARNASASRPSERRERAARPRTSWLPHGSGGREERASQSAGGGRGVGGCNEFWVGCC